MKKLVLRGILIAFMFTSILLLFNFSFSSATKINAKDIELEVGLNRLVRIEGIKSTKKIKWTSGNKKIAAVSKTGRVTGKNKGNTKVTAKLNGKKYTCNVKVIPKLTDLQRVKKLLKEQKKYTKRITPYNKHCFTWNKDKTKLLRINANGFPTGIEGNNDGIKFYVKSKYLDLSGFKYLRRVNLSPCEIDEINLNSLKHLWELTVDNGDVKYIDFYKVKSIVSIILDTGELENIPSSILKTLETAYFCNGVTKNINYSMLRSIEYLSVEGFPLKRLSLPNSSSLTTLNINSANNIKELNVSKLKNLRELYCVHNRKLAKLNLGSLMYLSELNCSYNKLTELNVRGLKNLERLDCRKNQIAELDLRGFAILPKVYCDPGVNIITD